MTKDDPIIASVLDRDVQARQLEVPAVADVRFTLTQQFLLALISKDGIATSIDGRKDQIGRARDTAERLIETAVALAWLKPVEPAA